MIGDGPLLEAARLRLDPAGFPRLAGRFEGHAVEDVIWGNVTQVMEQGGCLARSAVLMSDLDQSIPGLSINRFCASGMEAVNLAANQVKAGAGEAYIAGGVEMMGRVAMGSDGAAIAVEEAGLSGKVKIVGTSLPSVSGPYLESGEIAMISFWDPAKAGYAMNVVAAKVLNGETIADGADLGVEGYEKVKLDGKVIYGQAWVDVTAENMDQYDF